LKGIDKAFPCGLEGRQQWRVIADGGVVISTGESPRNVNTGFNFLWDRSGRS